MCDVWQKRVTGTKRNSSARAASTTGRSSLAATSTRWWWPRRTTGTRTIALEAMDKGKDVYLEKPMCHTIEEAKQLSAPSKPHGRVLQVGSQTTSGRTSGTRPRKAIADGMIGKMLMSQGSYHRNSTTASGTGRSTPTPGPTKRATTSSTGRRGWARRPSALRRGPLLPLPQVLGLFGRHRDGSLLPRGGAAEHLLARAAVPAKVMSAGGIREFKDREVPDTFNLIGGVRAGPLSGAEFLHGELAAHPGHDPRP